MRGPIKSLSKEERIRLYQKMVRFPLSFSEQDLACYIQNARLDARFAEVVTEHIRDYWWKYDAAFLNAKLKRQPWPEAIKPILNQISEFCSAEPSVKRDFVTWARRAIMGIGSAMPQLYFTTTTPPRGASQDREVSESLRSFSEAGFFARDLMFNKGKPGSIKTKPTDSNTILGSDDLLKLNLFFQLKPLLKDKTLNELEKEIGVDRTTLSKIRSGKIESISVGRMAQIYDKAKRPSLTPISGTITHARS